MKQNFETHRDRYWTVHKEMVLSNKTNVVIWAKEILQRNLISKVKRHVELTQKIENWIKKYYSEKNLVDVLNSIVSGDEYSISIFAIEITRQNISEKVQKKHLEEKGYKVKKLNASKGPRFSKDKLSIVFKKSEGLTSRSFDYQIDKNQGWVDYVLGKTTFNQGGGQNGAKTEIVQFLTAANQFCIANPNTKILFTALLDGDSYTKEDFEQYSQYCSERVRVFTSDTYQ
jgi:hypothetical protein